MSATTIPSAAPNRDLDTLPAAGPQVATLGEDLGNLSDLVAALASSDPRWEEVGPMTAAVAELVRQAAGRPGWGALDVDVAPVVHKRGLAVAARTLMGGAMTVVDGPAAIETRSLCLRVSLALA